MGDEVNPWGGLQQQARDGDITVEPNVATVGAAVVADALMMVEIVRAAVDRVRSFGGFGNLGSGNALAAKFFHAARELDGRLNDHGSLLREMGEMFVIVGKLYENSESDSAAAFGRIAEGRSGRWQGQPEVPHPKSVNGPNWTKEASLPEMSDGLRRVASDVNGRDPALVTAERAPDKPRDLAAPHEDWNVNSIRVENAYALEYTAYYELGQSLQGHLFEVSTAAGVWTWMADRLDTAFADLNNQLSQMQSNGSWEGNGATAAVATVGAYQGNVSALATGMRLIAENLHYTSGWLGHVGANMPRVPWANVGWQYARDELLPAARGAFQNWYIPGIQASSSAIPVLPAANSLITQPPVGPTGWPVTPNPTLGGAGAGSANSSVGPGPSAQQLTAAQQLARAAAAQQDDQQQDESTDVPQQDPEPDDQQAQQDAADAAEQQAHQEASAAEQQAMQQGIQAAQQGLSAAQQAAQEAMTGLSGLGGLPTNLAGPAIGGAEFEAAKSGAGGGGAKVGGGGPGLGSGPGSAVSKDLTQAAKLFPRAGAGAATATSAGGMGVGRAGAAPMGAIPGSPGAAGAAGRGAGSEGQQHKRPAFLDSTEHLKDALGEAQRVVKPVVDR